MKFVILFFVTIFFCSEASDEIIGHINSLNTTWKAGENFDKVTLFNVKKLFMSFYSKQLVPLKDKNINSDYNLNNYESFDARTKWPNCTSIGQIYDQGFCSPSWIYASVGQMADRICIKTGKNIDVKSTVENMMKGNYDCNSYFNSADIGQVFRYWSKKGIFIGKKEKECLPFSEQCQMQFHESNITDEYFSVAAYNPQNQIDIKHELLTRGPFSYHIDVYEDLLYYKSGVYQRISNVKLGSHVVKVIGWGQENGVEYWLMANSWGTKWGENGYFKLRRGFNELGIEGNGAVAMLEAATGPTSIDDQQLFLA